MITEEQAHVAARQGTASSRKVRVLIVDDSVVLRRLLVRMLGEDPGIEVVGSARNGLEALEKIAKLRPDAVTLDVEMPEMDGLESLRQIHALHPQVKVIMCSSLTERGAQVTVDALLAGASDYVTKLQGTSSQSNFEAMGEDLRRKIHSMSSPRKLSSTASRSVARALQPVHAGSGRKLDTKVLAIGVSTGGPAALGQILPLVPASFPVPILIVQHMPPYFSKLLAERLSKVSRIPVVEAETGMQLSPGTALLAPGDFHMGLVRKADRVEVVLNQDIRENSCRPAVDVLFRSVAEVYGGSVMALVLTGMGQDGLEGARQLKKLGASVLVQDEASSVVWGMPGAIAKANLADAVLPLNEMMPEVLERLCK